MNWIVETKGRVRGVTEEKDTAMSEWCRRMSAADGEYLRVDRSEFHSDFATFDKTGARASAA